jgi:hypothetical protein
LTINYDEPVISVRMPIYTPRGTHDRYYVEIRYKVVEAGLFMEFNLSDELINKLHSYKAAIAKLPPMPLARPPTLGHSAGSIMCLLPLRSSRSSTTAKDGGPISANTSGSRCSFWRADTMKTGGGEDYISRRSLT